MNNIKTNTLFYLLIGLFFLLNVWVSYISLSQVLIFIEHFYDLPKHKLGVLVNFVNEETWLKFKLAVLFFSVLLVIIYLYGLSVIKQIYFSFKYSIVLLKEDFRKLHKKEKFFLCSFLLCFGIYLLWLNSEIYFQLDELNSWIYFVDRGFFVAVSYYPSNNNHIGYNILSVFWKLFLDPSLAMRMTSILSSLGVIVVLYLMLRHRYNFLMASVGLAIMVSFSSYTWYSIQGRGYVLEMLLLILLFYFIEKAKTRNGDYTIVALSSYTLWVLPVAIIPLFVLGVLTLYIMRQDEFLVRRVCKVLFSVILISLLLHAPIFIFSDFSVLYGNPFVKHALYSDAPTVLMSEYLIPLGFFLTGVDGLYLLFMVISILGISLWMLVHRRYAVWYFMFVLFILPALLFLVYPVFLFERTWLWLLIPLVFMIIEMLDFLRAQANKSVVIGGVFFLVSGLVLVNVKRMEETRMDSKKWAFQLEELRRCSCENGINRVRIDNDILYTYFRYYQKYCGFVVKDNTEETQNGDWKLVLNQEGTDPRRGVICKNLIGILYKLE